MTIKPPLIAGDRSSGGNSDETLSSGRSLLLTLGIVASVAVLLWPTTEQLLASWSNDIGNSHGPLVLLVSLVLLARTMGKRTSVFLPTPPRWLLLLALGLSFVWIVSYVAAIQAFQMVCLIGLLYCAFALVGGARPRTLFAFPVGLLVFALPVWGHLAPLLQSITVQIVSGLLGFIGWRAYLSGDTVHVGAGSFEIAQGCAGVHFFVVALIIGSLYAYLNLTRASSKIGFVLVAAVIAMIANWLRVFTLVIVGDLTDMKHYLIAVDHYYFGWALFLVALLPLFWIGFRFQAWDSKAPRSSSATATSEGIDASSAKSISGLGMVGILFLTFPAFAMGALHLQAETYQLRDLSMPPEIGDWLQSDDSMTANIPAPSFKNPAFEKNATYTRDKHKLHAYINRYTQQRQGAEIVGSGNRWFPASWTSVSRRQTLVNFNGEPTDTVLDELQQSDSDRYVMVRAYIVAGGVTSSAPAVKLWNTLSTLMGRPAAGAFAVIAECESDNCVEASENAVEFASAFLPVAAQYYR